MDVSRDFLKEYMRRCINIAKQASPLLFGFRVGAILLSSDGKVIGEGYKSILPGTRSVIHAERMAIEDSYPNRLGGGTLISTLEPCLQIKENQLFVNCSKLIVDSGIKSVVFGLYDGNFKFIDREAHRYLRNRGIEVICLEEMALEIQQELIGPYQEHFYYRTVLPTNF